MAARISMAPVNAVLLFGLTAGVGVLAGAQPTLALAAAAGAAFIAVLLASFPAATGVFIIITFVNLPDNAAKAIGVLLAIALLARIASGTKQDLNFSSTHPGATAALVGFLVWSLLGVVWADSTSAVTTALLRYALNFALFFIVYAAVRTRNDLLLLVAMFALGCAIAAIYGVINPPPPGLYDDVSRTGGTLGDPNELAAVLVVGLVVSAALSVLRSVPSAVRVCAIAGSVFCGAGIALTVSRGGLLALGVALMVGIFVAGRWRVHMAALAAVVAIGIVAYFGSYASPQTLQRITTAQGGSGRSDVWLVGWRMFTAHPVGGVGAGNFPIVSVQYLLRPGTITASRYIVNTPKVAHNTYLNVLAEDGIVGAALFVGILVFGLRCYRTAWRGFRRTGDRDLEILAYALFIGLVGFLAASFFLSEEYSKQLWILLALAPAMRRVSRGVRREPARVAEVIPAQYVPVPG